MLISEIGIRGYKSFGNNEQVLKLDTDKGKLILLTGGNGRGKSVDIETEIEVDISIVDFNNKEYNVLLNILGNDNFSFENKDNKENIITKITLNKLNQLQTKIKIIDNHLVKVFTENGFKKVKAIGITSPNSIKVKIKTKDFKLLGSPSHRVKYLNKWIFLKNIKVGDSVNTKKGIQKVISVEKDNNKEDLWDIEVEGSEYFSNGILSHNSSFLESFEYTLYGKVKSNKAKKWYKLSTLPNRINGELLNRIKFKAEGVDVEIKRGISPNKLELWENGVKNKKAGKSNINDKIEEYVGLDIETFKSFISMSINDFKNFISLSREEKQLLLDKLFNLEVINILNSILKDINKVNKQKIAVLDSEIVTLEQSIESINKSIKKSLEKEKENLQAEINDIIKEANSKKNEYINLKSKVNKIKEKEDFLKKEIDNENRQLINTNNDIRNVQKEIDLYNSGKCPTCATDFTSDRFVELKSSLIEKKNGYIKIKDEINVNINNLKSKQKKLKEIASSTTESFNDLNYLLKNSKAKMNELKEKQNNSKEDDSVNVLEFKNTIKELTEKKETSSEYVSERKEKELYYKELNRIFSEEGVKKSIIKNIIKPINHFIKENIQKMSLNFDVELDETFTAEIKSLGRIINHDSLSTGETKLLNLSILVAYLKLIRTKKNINILFLDEVFSSIDLGNIDHMLTLLKSFADEYNINIFVVHHAILSQEMFDRIIKIDKNVFSNIEEVDINEY